MRRLLFAVLVSVVGCATSIEDVEGTPFRRDTGASIADSLVDEDTGSTTADSKVPSVDTSTGPTDTGSAVDTGTSPTDTGSAVDTMIEDTAVADTAVADTGSTGSGEITFPATGDTKSIAKDPYIWTNGDYLEGSRTTTLASATSLTGTWNVTNSVGTCGLFGTTTGKVNVDVLLNGTKVGALVIKGSTGASVPIALTFPAVTGPTYKLRYQLTATVASGCGQIETSWDTSKLTLK